MLKPHSYEWHILWVNQEPQCTRSQWITDDPTHTHTHTHTHTSLVCMSSSAKCVLIRVKSLHVCTAPGFLGFASQWPTVGGMQTVANTQLWECGWNMKFSSVGITVHTSAEKPAISSRVDCILLILTCYKYSCPSRNLQVNEVKLCSFWRSWLLTFAT
jgi:hypothetical protein